jgi:hypothetical protein
MRALAVGPREHANLWGAVSLKQFFQTRKATLLGLIERAMGKDAIASDELAIEDTSGIEEYDTVV